MKPCSKFYRKKKNRDKVWNPGHLHTTVTIRLDPRFKEAKWNKRTWKHEILIPTTTRRKIKASDNCRFSQYCNHWVLLLWWNERCQSQGHRPVSSQQRALQRRAARTWPCHEVLAFYAFLTQPAAATFCKIIIASAFLNPHYFIGQRGLRFWVSI